MIKKSHLNIFFIFILIFQVPISFSYAQVKIDENDQTLGLMQYHSNDHSICYYANSSTAPARSRLSAIKEAKRRGLDCAVEDDEAEKKRMAEEKARN